MRPCHFKHMVAIYILFLVGCHSKKKLDGVRHVIHVTVVLRPLKTTHAIVSFGQFGPTFVISFRLRKRSDKTVLDCAFREWRPYPVDVRKNRYLRISSSSWGYPHSWMVYYENPIYKWMMTGGSPMTQETTSSKSAFSWIFVTRLAHQIH